MYFKSTVQIFTSIYSTHVFVRYDGVRLKWPLAAVLLCYMRSVSRITRCRKLFERRGKKKKQDENQYVLTCGGVSAVRRRFCRVEREVSAKTVRDTSRIPLNPERHRTYPAGLCAGDLTHQISAAPFLFCVYRVRGERGADRVSNCNNTCTCNWSQTMNRLQDMNVQMYKMYYNASDFRNMFGNNQPLPSNGAHLCTITSPAAGKNRFDDVFFPS